MSIRIGHTTLDRVPNDRDGYSVLVARARLRPLARLVRSVMLGVGLEVILAACGAAPSTGVVLGGIERCQAIISSDGPRYVGGTVAVYAGEPQWKSTSPQRAVPVFPGDIVAMVHVDDGSTYRLVLPPGAYVLRAHYDAPTQGIPWVSVTIHAGETAAVDVPGTCI